MLASVNKKTAILSVILATTGTAAKADPAYLCIDNTAGSGPVVATITTIADRYQGPGEGHQQTAAKGQRTRFDMGRDSSVSGSVGTVCLTFSPADENGNSQQCFRIHGGNNIEKLGLNVVANPYSGKWMGNESGCWSIQTANSLGSGKAVGSWVSVRTGGTAKGKVNMSKSFNVGGSSEQSVSTEVRNAISSTVELGVEFIPGGSGSVSVTGSRETANTEASSIAKTFDNGDAISCEQDVDTETYDYEVMWQWQIHTTTGATQATIATCTVACTSTGATPTFPPGSPQQLASCKIRR